MKLIHCADLHLDSPMESNLSAQQARERKGEILATFAKTVRLAAASEVSAILIAGDLFDSDHITARTEKYVLDLIASHPTLSFFYLAGNHDRGNHLRQIENKPENLYLFGDGWTSYELGEVTVTGSEKPDPDTLRLDEKKTNILLLHGQERAGRGAEKADIIRFVKYKDKHIDYMALGHLHEYRTAAIDARCTACYAGCLEGRGFDECGKKGYVLLETDPRGGLTHQFVPVAKRTLHTVSCDITGFTSQLDLENRLLESVREIPESDLIKVVLTGACPAQTLVDIPHLTQVLSEGFYFVKIVDESRLLIHPEEYAHDISLKGEFVRRVMASDLKDAEKERVIACGFRALTGEEIGF